MNSYILICMYPVTPQVQHIYIYIYTRHALKYEKGYVPAVVCLDRG